jgi:GNAT superfamily N-acetyltransferase
MEWNRDNYMVTTNILMFNMDFIVVSLQKIWRKGATSERIKNAFSNSFSFGVFDEAKQIGCVRAVTDRCFVSWICDLYLDPAYRGKGLGKWLMGCVMGHPNLKQTRLVLSSIPEFQTFYKDLGFLPMERGHSRKPGYTNHKSR